MKVENQDSARWVDCGVYGIRSLVAVLEGMHRLVEILRTLGP